MQDLTEDRIKALFTSADQACSSELAARICAQVRACGGVDEAVAVASAQADLQAAGELVRLRSILKEAAAPELKAARLRCEAADLDERAERLMAQAAELFGRSAYRAAQGEQELAADFASRAAALEACAAELGDRAFDHRLNAAGTEWRLAQGRSLSAVAA